MFEQWSAESAVRAPQLTLSDVDMVVLILRL